jgi:hypothetical protein
MYQLKQQKPIQILQFMGHTHPSSSLVYNEIMFRIFNEERESGFSV